MIPKLISTEEEILAVLSVMRTYAKTANPATRINNMLDQAAAHITALLRADIPAIGMIWNDLFMQVGGMLMQIHQDMLHDQRWREFARFLLEKHNKYGASPIRRWGSIGVVIRIDSKWQRFLSTSGQDNEDTVLDMIGYCILGYKVSRENQ